MKFNFREVARNILFTIEVLIALATVTADALAVVLDAVETEGDVGRNVLTTAWLLEFSASRMDVMVLKPFLVFNGHLQLLLAP